MIQDGNAAATDLVWTEGMAAWKPIFEVMPPPAAAPPPADPDQTRPMLAQYPAPTPVPAPAPTPTPAPYTPPPAAQPQYTPPSGQPQYAPAQQYAPPAAAPQYAPQYAPSAGPIPNGMHWALLLVLGFIPLFPLIWLLAVQMSFVKKVDPRNQSMKLFLLGIGLEILAFPIIFGGAMLGGLLAGGDEFGAGGSVIAILGSLLGFGVILGAVICILMAIFKMRSSLVSYYNTVEPIGLRLSGVMTFFFNMYYFQYHFSRIHDWKTTGRLTPQG